MTDPSPSSDLGPVIEKHYEVEARCPSCGWYVLIPPGTVDMPCPCVANEIKPGWCLGKITASKHATAIQHEMFVDLKSRVAALLRECEP